MSNKIRSSYKDLTRIRRFSDIRRSIVNRLRN